MNINFKSVVSTLQHWATTTPNKTAYTFLTYQKQHEINISYKELDIKAKAIAATLQFITSKGDRVILLYPSGLEFIAAFYGCLYAGVIAVPVFHKIKQNPERLLAIMNDAQPTVVLTTGSISVTAQGILGEKFKMVKWQTTDLIKDNRARYWQPFEATKATTAFLQYTSGSTSQPKGVMISHENLLYQFKIISTSSYKDSNRKILTWLPLYHDMGLIGNILFNTYLGGQCYFMSPISFLKRPIRWLQAISDYEINMSGAPNFAYDLVVNKIKEADLNTLNLQTWKVAFCGAEPIRSKH